MIGRIAAVVLAFSWLPDCKGAGEQGSFEKFVTPTQLLKVGTKEWEQAMRERKMEEMCAEAHDGKRFWLAGYLQLPRDIEIKNGRTRLYFYEGIDGNGRGTGRSITSVEVTSPGNIEDLWASATGKKFTGARSSKAQIDEDALRIRISNGLANARDKIKLTFDIVALPERNLPFESRQIAGCKYQFVKAEKA
jgi:hypothetical protein